MHVQCVAQDVVSSEYVELLHDFMKIFLDRVSILGKITV